MDLKKDILSLDFQKFLQYKVIVILMSFSLVIALIIPFLTKQLNVRAIQDWVLVGIISIAFLGVMFVFFFRYGTKMNKILNQMGKWQGEIEKSKSGQGNKKRKK